MHNILVLEPEYFDGQAMSVLKRAGRVKAKRLTRAQLESEIHNFDVVVVRIETHLDEMLLKRAARLKIIGSATTGLDHIDMGYAARHKIKIISLHGTHTVSTAEHAFALILSLARRIPWAYESLSRGTWKRYRFIGEQLEDKTLGIIGLGRIGRRVAVYGRAFGMNVIYYDPYVNSSELARKVQLDELLKKSDVISLHAALTAGSRHLIGKVQFRMLKKNALIINTARSEMIDSNALIEALKKGRIQGAAIDVFENEPLEDKSNPIVAYARTHKNLIITPHIGASTREASHGAGLEIAQGIARELHAQYHAP